MKAKEVAGILRIGVPQVKRYIKLGRLKAELIPRERGVGGHTYWWVTQEQLDEYLLKYQD